MAKPRNFDDARSKERLVLWNVRLPEDLLKRLRERAGEMEHSASWLARRYISEGLDRKKSLT